VIMDIRTAERADHGDLAPHLHDQRVQGCGSP
jgi:hypothetical protein